MAPLLVLIVGCSEEHCSTCDTKLYLLPNHLKNCKKYSDLLHIISNSTLMVADILSI